jgi:hypothetical protein
VPALVAVPDGVVTDHRFLPLDIAGTVAVIWVEEMTVKLTTVVPSLTAIAPVKFVPVIVTWRPGPPDVGEKLLMVGAGIVGAGIVGAGITVKADELMAVPEGVVTEMGPVVAPVGTVACRRESEATV